MHNFYIVSLKGIGCSAAAAAVASVVSDSVRPHRRQPTRLLCPWDSPGKSTGVVCHCLLWTLVRGRLYQAVKTQAVVQDLGELLVSATALRLLILRPNHIVLPFLPNLQLIRGSCPFYECQSLQNKRFILIFVPRSSGPVSSRQVGAVLSSLKAT